MELISKDLPESKYKKFLSDEQQNYVYKNSFCLYKNVKNL